MHNLACIICLINPSYRCSASWQINFSLNHVRQCRLFDQCGESIAEKTGGSLWIECLGRLIWKHSCDTRSRIFEINMPTFQMHPFASICLVTSLTAQVFEAELTIGKIKELSSLSFVFRVIAESLHMLFSFVVAVLVICYPMEMWQVIILAVNYHHFCFQRVELQAVVFAK